MTARIQGLAFPTDLAAWTRWQNSRRRLSRFVGRLRAPRDHQRPSAPLFATGPDNADVIVAFDSVNPATVRTFRAVVAQLRGSGATVTVVDSGDTRLRRSVTGQTRVVAAEDISAGSVIGIGHYATAGAALWRHSRRREGRFFVLQHGLLTPFAPPLPHGAHLLAWSGDDAAFWTAGRADAHATTVGSHMLSCARAEATDPSDARDTDRPLFLGQMHGAELGWFVKIRSAMEFCRKTGALYRPHPSETSQLSHAAHSALRAAGVEIDTSPSPLSEWRGPIVGMFSTGLLEAAAAGQRTFGYATPAPEWVEEFWIRYQIGGWPDSPTQLDESLAPHDPDAVVRMIVDEVGTQ